MNLAWHCKVAVQFFDSDTIILATHYYCCHRTFLPSDSARVSRRHCALYKFTYLLLLCLFLSEQHKSVRLRRFESDRDEIFARFFAKWIWYIWYNVDDLMCAWNLTKNCHFNLENNVHRLTVRFLLWWHNFISYIMRYSINSFTTM